MESSAGIRSKLDGLGVLYVSLHNLWPADTGANELVTPRATLTLGAATGTQRALTDTVEIIVPAQSTVRFFGLWQAAVGGGYMGCIPLMGTWQKYEIKSGRFRKPNHRFVNGQQLVFSETPPTGLTAGTIYFVVNRTYTFYDVAATAGGAPIVIGATFSGGSRQSKISPESFIGAGKLSLSTLTLRYDSKLGLDMSWTGSPGPISFQGGTPDSYSLVPYLTGTDAAATEIGLESGILQAGVSIGALTHTIDYDGTASSGAASIVISAAGADSPAISVTVASGSVAWTTIPNQSFTQGMQPTVVAGGIATASSTYSGGGSYTPAGAINGDRKGQDWAAGAGSTGWNDGTQGVFPDWLQVTFASAKTINRIDVFTLQDNYSAPVDPTTTTTFSLYGILDFDIQTWNGTIWATVPGGAITNNNLVWRTVSFSAITTDRIRVLVSAVKAGAGGYSRIVELEAWSTDAVPVNVALASSGSASIVDIRQFVTNYQPGVTNIDRTAGADGFGITWNNNLDRIQYDGSGAGTLNGWQFRAQTPGAAVSSNIISLVANATATAAVISGGNIPTLSILPGQSQSVAPFFTHSAGAPMFFALDASSTPLPAYATLSTSGLFAHAANAPVNAVVSGLKVTATDIQAGVGITTLQLTSTVTGTDLPFSVGHVFKMGDIPSAFTVGGDTTNFQCVVKNRWSDGSVQIAILSGRAAFTANVAKIITLSRVVASTTTPIALASLQAAAPQASVAIAGFGTVNLSSLLAAPLKQWVSGPQMSSWHFASPVGADADLYVWFRVALWANNFVEVNAWIENGFEETSGPDKTGVVTYTVGGVQRYTGSVVIYAKKRAPLGPYFVGTNPNITPKHDAAYMRSTKLVPNYGYGGAAAGTFAQYALPISPTGLGWWRANMSAPGYSPTIGPLTDWEAAYVASGDPDAYRATINNGYMAGIYTVHDRDRTTMKPLAPAKFPTKHHINKTYVAYPAEPEGGAHQPAMGYLPYLLTGELYFLEEVQFWASYNHYEILPGYRGNEKGWLDVSSGHQVRGFAWSLRQLALAITVSTDDDPLKADFQRCWKNNVVRTAGQYLDGVAHEVFGFGDMRNNLGIAVYDLLEHQFPRPLSFEGNNYYKAAQFEQHFLQFSIGFAWDLEVNPDAASKTAHQRARDFFYKAIVGLLGDGTTAFCYQFASEFSVYYTKNGINAVNYMASWKEVYDFAGQPFAGQPACVAGGILKSDNFTVPSVYSQAILSLFTTSTWGNLQPAISMAVDHGAPGATAAYARMTAASSWSAQSAGWPANPVWGVKPR